MTHSTRVISSLSASEKGLDVKMLADVAKSGEVQGEVAVIEDHEKNEKKVISIE